MWCSSQGAVERWSAEQFAQIIHYEMRAMQPKLIGSPVAGAADHKPKVPVYLACTPERASSTTTARAGLNPEQLCRHQVSVRSRFAGQVSGVDYIAIDL